MRNLTKIDIKNFKKSNLKIILFFYKIHILGIKKHDLTANPVPRHLRLRGEILLSVLAATIYLQHRTVLFENKNPNPTVSKLTIESFTNHTDSLVLSSRYNTGAVLEQDETFLEKADPANVFSTLSEIKPNQLIDFKKKYFSYLNKFLINFFQFFFTKKVYLTFKKLWWQSYFLENTHTHANTLNKIRKYARKIRNSKFLINLYKIMWISLKIKDSSFFLKWFNDRVELLFFRFHKNLPYLINIIIKQFSHKLFTETNTKGIKFTFRGKISSTGDSKKKHVTVKHGKHSNTTKSLMVSLARSQVKTRNGVMGLSFSIYF